MKIIAIILLLALAAAAIFLAYMLVKVLLNFLTEFVQAVLTIVILLAVTALAVLVMVVAIDKFGLLNVLGGALILGALGWIVHRLRKRSRNKSSNPAAHEQKRRKRAEDGSDGK